MADLFSPGTARGHSVPRTHGSKGDGNLVADHARAIHQATALVKWTHAGQPAQFGTEKVQRLIHARQNRNTATAAGFQRSEFAIGPSTNE